ncbi:MAG: hypothetical protein RLZZ177_104 [Pseudomonadota bacterium]
MTDPTWPRVDSPQSSDWPCLQNASTSETPAKEEDDQLTKLGWRRCAARRVMMRVSQRR